MATDLSSMRKALAARDHAALKELAHGLKGTSASMGAARIAALCAALETSCEAGQLDRSELQLNTLECEASSVSALFQAEIER